MSVTGSETPNLHFLAKRLERDIRTRGLLSGQRYLTGVEAGHLLGVSTTTANRAMSLLVRRNVLIRQRRSGTFIGSAVEARMATQTRSIQVLIPSSRVVDVPNTVPTDLLMQGIRAVLGEVDIRFSFLPPVDAVPYAKRVIERSLRDEELVGVVPVSCGPDVYRFVSDAQIPGVVLGSLYSLGDRLGSVDVDNRQQACLLVRHLVERGHRRMAAFNGSQHCPGDSHFNDGVAQGLTESGLPPSAALMRFIPDPEALRAELRELMALEDRPTGIITSTLRLADAVRQIVSTNWPGFADQVEIVFRGPAILPVELAPYVHARPTARFEEVAILVGKMLKRMSEDPAWQAEHVVLPVELHYPQGYRK